jgi:hypothetical protein
MGGGRSWTARHRMWALAVLGLPLLLGGVAVLAMPYRHSLLTARAYEEASGTLVVPAVVKDLENYSNGRGGTYWVEVQGPVSVSGRIELDDSDPVLSRLSKGDRIEISIWHGRRTDIAFDGRVQETTEAPTPEPGLWLGGGLGLLHVGVLAFYAAIGLRRGMREPTRSGPEEGFTLTGKMIAGSAAVACFAGVVASGTHESDPLTYAVIWLMLALMALAMWRVTSWVRGR